MNSRSASVLAAFFVRSPLTAHLNRFIEKVWIDRKIRRHVSFD
jgi:hypothetical protein